MASASPMRSSAGVHSSEATQVNVTCGKALASRDVYACGSGQMMRTLPGALLRTLLGLLLGTWVGILAPLCSRATLRRVQPDDMKENTSCQHPGADGAPTRDRSRICLNSAND